MKDALGRLVASLMPVAPSDPRREAKGRGNVGRTLCRVIRHVTRAQEEPPMVNARARGAGYPGTVKRKLTSDLDIRLQCVELLWWY